MSAFAALLAQPGVEEVSELRGRVGFMAYHGGALEAMTDVIARRAAEQADASCYSVIQPPGMRDHLPSIEVNPGESSALAAFVEHVDIVITVHGYGRRGLFGSLLLGGGNRPFAEHVGHALRRTLPAYDIRTDIAEIPKPLRGLHPANPVNLPRDGGVQIELPPRVRGSSPLWWDWEGPGLTPHTESLIAGLADAATTWSSRTATVMAATGRTSTSDR
ncbi:MAG TPA: poly-gamma-glutamate hydrolase family protein [Ilumatobacteraceae bacterium]|nr:poly-gamma-glutamate hydrolase family protein [Ilumatobacteraceae bacterium]